jgi:hypothetical protein
MFRFVVLWTAILVKCRPVYVSSSQQPTSSVPSYVPSQFAPAVAMGIISSVFCLACLLVAQ